MPRTSVRVGQAHGRGLTEPSSFGRRPTHPFFTVNGLAYDGIDGARLRALANQGLDAFLGTLGTSLDTVFDEFSCWRAVTGSYDDGEHFPDGDRYATADAVPMSLDSLPATLEYELHEYGSAHVLLADGADAAPFTLSVTVEERATFGVSLLLWKPEEPVERREGTFVDREAVFDIATLDGVARAVLEGQEGRAAFSASPVTKPRTVE